jgi:hypothetical protein
MGRGGFSKGGKGGKFGRKGSGGGPKRGSKPKRRTMKGKSPKGGKENKVFGAMIMEKKKKRMDLPVKSSDLKDDFVPKKFQDFQRRMLMGTGKYPSTGSIQKERKPFKNSSAIQPRKALESVPAFMNRVDKETRNNVVEEIRASKTASASTKRHHQLVQERKQLKKTEREVDRKEREIFRDHVPFGEVADRPPEIKVRPQIKKKAVVLDEESTKKRVNDLIRDRMILAYNNAKKMKSLSQVPV